MTQRLVAVELDGMKGQHVSHELSGPVLLAGPNGCGKTAALEAIRLALGGQFVGVQVERLARLFEARGGTVRVEDASGAWLSRGVRVDAEKGTVAELLELSGCQGSLRDRQAVAVEAWAAAPVALDVAALLGLPAEGRRDFLLKVAGSQSQLPAAELLALVEGALARELGGAGAAREVLTRPPDTLAPKVRSAAESYGRPGALGDRLSARLRGTSSWEVALGCDALLEEATAAKREAGKAAKEAAQAAQELARSEAELSQAAELVDALAARVADAERVEQRSREAEAAYREARDQTARALARVDAAGAGLDVARRQLSTVPAAAAVPFLPTAAEAATLETLARDVAHEAQGAAERVDELRKAFRETLDAANARNIARKYVSDQLADAEQELQELRGGAEGRLGAAVEAAESAKALQKSATARELIDAAAAVLQGWRGRLERLLAFRDKLGAEALPVAELPEEPAELAAAETKLAELKARQRDVEDSASEAGARLRAAIGARDAVMRGNQEHEGARQLYSERVTAAAARVDEARRAHEAAEAREAVQGGAVPESDGGKLAEARAALRDATEARGALQALRAARDRTVEQQAAELVADAAQKAVRDVRRQLLEDAVAPLLSDVDRFLDAAGVGAVAECRLVNLKGKPACELGWLPAGESRLVTVEALSGGETVLFAAALVSALVGRLPYRPVLLVEADPCDSENLGRLLAGISAVARADWSVLVATSRQMEPAELPAGWILRRNEGGAWASYRGGPAISETAP